MMLAARVRGLRAREAGILGEISGVKLTIRKSLNDGLTVERESNWQDFVLAVAEFVETLTPVVVRAHAIQNDRVTAVMSDAVLAIGQRLNGSYTRRNVFIPLTRVGRDPQLREEMHAQAAPVQEIRRELDKPE
jgi:hypothetical protein